ncbi:RhoGEF domain [Pelomyxa schiedti]|nr:RhoGEF domain [Pelomyxa schiedti]
MWWEKLRTRRVEVGCVVTIALALSMGSTIPINNMLKVVCTFGLLCVGLGVLMSLVKDSLNELRNDFHVSREVSKTNTPSLESLHLSVRTALSEALKQMEKEQLSALKLALSEFTNKGLQLEQSMSQHLEPLCSKMECQNSLICSVKGCIENLQTKVDSHFTDTEASVSKLAKQVQELTTKVETVQLNCDVLAANDKQLASQVELMRESTEAIFKSLESAQRSTKENLQKIREKMQDFVDNQPQFVKAITSLARKVDETKKLVQKSSTDELRNSCGSPMPALLRESTSLERLLAPPNTQQLEEAIPEIQAIIVAHATQAKYDATSYRRNVIQELLATEQSYVKNLQTVLEDYINPLKVANPPILTEAEILQVFSNWSKIYETNVSFYELLTTEFAEMNHLSKKVASVFSSPQMAAMKSYLPYILNYDTSLAKISQLTASNELFSAHCKQAVAKTGTSLGGFLIQPVQRLPRYLLLLQDYTRKRAKSKYIEQLKEAQKIVLELTTGLNETKRHIEHLERLSQLYTLFKGDLKKMIAWHADLQVIKEGPVEAKKGVDYCVLLSQCLVLVQRTKTKRTEEMKICSLLMCDKITKVTTVQQTPSKGCVMVSRIRPGEKQEREKKLIVGLNEMICWADLIRKAAHLSASC